MMDLPEEIEAGPAEPAPRRSKASVWIRVGALLAVGLVGALAWLLKPLWSAPGSGDTPSRSITLRSGRTELPGGTVVDLSDHGAAEWLSVGQRRTRIILDRGSMAVTATQPPAASTVEVATSRYVFRVLGARFWVALSDRCTRIEVTEGQVAVMLGGSWLANVSAGQSWEGATAY
jgi:ferric-dicitrate binding protein FerR (iron transport regulator)